MKTVPPKYSATFVSLAQSAQYLSTVASPLLGTILADQVGIGGALVISAILRLGGFALFAWQKAPQPYRVTVRASAQSTESGHSD
ncbi:MAG: hypothetical protein HY259_02955 [Chloroflexi bacterium]|nr:hypothetical protein [Chloroflexota bacterium]